ncbi:MAG: hypothetical protein AAF581_02725 [Planctomycetota bacterium]
MRLQLRTPLLLSALLVAATPLPTSADWVELASGSRFYGQIIEQNDASVVIASQGEQFRFPLDQVRTFHRDQAPAAAGPAYQTRIWGAIESRVPSSFVELERDRPAFGSSGHLVALYEEAATGSLISVVRSGRPFGARDFNAAAQALSAHLQRNRQLDQERWERQSWHGHPALTAELSSRDNLNRVRYLQSWIETAPGTVYCVSVVVPEGEFLLSTDHYRHILGTLRPHTPTQ